MPTFQQTIPPWPLFLFGTIVSILSTFSYAAVSSAYSIPVDLFQSLFNDSYEHIFNSTMSAEYMAFIWGVTVSISPSSAILGCFIAAYLANSFGRKRALMLIPKVITIIGATFCFSFKYLPYYHLLIFGLCICGIACGIELTVLPIYIIELSPVYCRGFMATLQGVFSALLASICAQLSTESALGNASLWPWLVCLQVFPALIQLICIPAFPESAQYTYLVLRKEDSARRILKRLLLSDALVDSTLDDMKLEREMESKQQQQQQITWKEIFMTPHYLIAIAVGTVAFWTQDFNGATAFTAFPVLTLNSLGYYGQTAETISLLYFWVAVPFVLISPILCEIFGRRPMLLINLLILLVTCLAVFVSAVVIKSFPHAHWVGVIGAGAILLNGIVYVIAPGPIPWFLGSELVPERVRAVSAGFNTSLGWVSSLIVTLAYPVLLLNIGPYVHMILAIVPLGLCLIFLDQMMPETKQKHMHEVLEDLQTRVQTMRRFLRCCRRQEDGVEPLLEESSQVVNRIS